MTNSALVFTNSATTRTAYAIERAFMRLPFTARYMGVSRSILSVSRCPPLARDLVLGAMLTSPEVYGSLQTMQAVARKRLITPHKCSRHKSLEGFINTLRCDFSRQGTSLGILYIGGLRHEDT